MVRSGRSTHDDEAGEAQRVDQVVSRDVRHDAGPILCAPAGVSGRSTITAANTCRTISRRRSPFSASRAHRHSSARPKERLRRMVHLHPQGEPLVGADLQTFSTVEHLRQDAARTSARPTTRPGTSSGTASSHPAQSEQSSFQQPHSPRRLNNGVSQAEGGTACRSQIKSRLHRARLLEVVISVCGHHWLSTEENDNLMLQAR